MPQAPNLTPDGQLGLVAEHAHGDAAQLRPSHDRGWNCGTEQMKTELLGNCYSITPNAGMLKRDPADSETRALQRAIIDCIHPVHTSCRTHQAPTDGHTSNLAYSYIKNPKA
ncbi:hypothetical protein NDU88_005173 [Pleurodeles waltl]|uniref:Uncharacterized protein n=1 Tax=Pleurodeles waltl TaxID=8319 RepID=A0AAV7SL34_PLEWA|nr:hypothetical protein NDU88_005173 [Pleurodeles waltl]